MAKASGSEGMNPDSLKKLNSYLLVSDNYPSIWGQAIGVCGSSQLQVVCDVAGGFDPFQFSFMPGFGIETA